MSNDTAQAHVEKIIALARDRRKHKSESEANGNDPEQRGWPNPKPLPNGLAPVEAFELQISAGCTGAVGGRCRQPAAMPPRLRCGCSNHLARCRHRASHRYQAAEENRLG